MHPLIPYELDANVRKNEFRIRGTLFRLFRAHPVCADKNGFTLLEMVISFGIFAVLVVASVSMTIAVSNASLKAGNIQAVMDNVRFSIELITKEMRTGTQYALTNYCTPGGLERKEISFLTATGENRTYFLNDSGQIMRAKTAMSAADCADPAKIKPLTADEVLVERLNFSYLRGEIVGPLDGQPRVTISVRIKSRDVKSFLGSSVDLQTTVVQRLRDF